MQFSAGRVLSRSFTVTIQNFVTFFVLALIVSAPVIVVGHLLKADDSVGMDPGVRLDEYGELVVTEAKGSPASQGIVMLLNMIAQGVLAGALAFGVFQALRGQRVSLGACLSRGFARLLPIVVISLVTGVGVMLGMLLLIVPGIMLACAWYVAVPVTAVERLGVGAALTRSQDLTRGYRWSIFGMFMLLIVLMLLVMTVLVGLFSAMGSLPAAIISGLVGVFLGLYGGVLGAVAYHDLRITKEGATTDELVKAFE